MKKLPIGRIISDFIYTYVMLYILLIPIAIFISLIFILIMFNFSAFYQTLVSLFEFYFGEDFKGIKNLILFFLTLMAITSVILNEFGKRIVFNKKIMNYIMKLYSIPIILIGIYFFIMEEDIGSKISLVATVFVAWLMSIGFLYLAIYLQKLKGKMSNET